MSATCRRRVEMSPILAQHACRVRHKREPDTYVSTLVCCCVVSSPHHVTFSCHVPLHLVAASCLAITSRRCVVYCLVAASRLCLLSHLFCLVDCCVVALNIVGVVSPCESCRCAASRHRVVSLHLVGALYLIVAMSLVSLSRPVTFCAAAVAESHRCNLQRPLNTPPKLPLRRRHHPTISLHCNI
jgi:hypothetical protein